VIDLEEFERTYLRTFTKGPLTRELTELVGELKAARKVVSAATETTSCCVHSIICTDWCEECRAAVAARDRLTIELLAYVEATR